MRTLELKHYIKQFVCLPLKKILSTHIVYDKCVQRYYSQGGLRRKTKNRIKEVMEAGKKKFFSLWPGH